MTEGWTHEEEQTNRRIVKFNREQVDNRITASFRPVTPTKLEPDSIYISCILWTRRNEKYATSADTVRLLESLMAVRFTKMDKYHVRRRIDSYGSLAVKSNDIEGGQFLSVVKDFPNPKPLHYCRYVKLLRWKDLGSLLQEVIEKQVSL